ncbi:MAG TPA: peroxiredoxin [Beijerinckiaceae bacterium]|nr:peroxiredoxin [Rhodoblastus sp.]MCC0001130.1 peroxiredoxin [Methylobacteriaceae bacterium]HRY02515.1 peroxiredoxin [Beijerinckiaceae bacterium]
MAEMPGIGAKAPEFNLERDGGGNAKLADFKGRKLVLYFYPKDDTSGCTTEAKDFSALAKDFEKAGAVVVGVSPDPAKKHDRFKAKHDLAITLLSDESTAILEAWGVWKEKSMYGRRYMGVERTTFLIDGKGIVRQIWPKVKVAGHAQAVLEAARILS